MDNFARYDAMRGEGYFIDSGISVTPATPLTGRNEPAIHDLDMAGFRTPTSECGSPSGSGYSPCFSDTSCDSEAEHSYTSEPSRASPQAPFSPSLSPLQMFNNMSLDATLSSSRYTQYPSANLPSLSPVFSLLDFSDCGHRELSLEDNSDASSAHSPFESGPPLLLFDPAQLPPRVVFHSEADHPTVSAHSRTYSDITTGSNDRLTAPPFRRHSFNTQRSRATFFWPESGSSTPDTPSSPFPSSDYLFRHPQVAQQSAASYVFSAERGPSTPHTPSSPFPPSPYSSAGTSPELPLCNPQVASPAGVHAANLRRKKQAKFRCKYCQATLTTKHNLTNHLNSHEGKRPYACGLCGATFGTISVKKRHQKNCKGLVATH